MGKARGTTAFSGDRGGSSSSWYGWEWRSWNVEPEKGGKDTTPSTDNTALQLCFCAWAISFLWSCLSYLLIVISSGENKNSGYSLSGSHFQQFSTFVWHSSPAFRVIPPPPHSSRNQFVLRSTSASGWGKGRSRSCLGFGQGWKVLLISSLFFLSSLLWCASSSDRRHLSSKTNLFSKKR